MEDDFKKQLLGVGTEIGGGVGTDLATSPLLGLGPAGIAGYVGINAFQGSFTNYQVQKYLNPDEDVNWGEVISSGVFGAIPFMDIPSKAKYAKYLGKAGSLKRAVVGGGGIGLAGQQLNKAFDSGEFLTPTEAGLAIGIGGAAGGSIKAVGDKLSSSLVNKVKETGTLSQRTTRRMEKILNPNWKEKIRSKLTKEGLIDPDGNVTLTEYDKSIIAKDRKFWENINVRRVGMWVKEFNGTPQQGTTIFLEEKAAFGRQKSAATWLNKYFKALTTELDDDGVPLSELVIGEVNGKIRLVEKGSPNSYPQAFEVDHRRAIQELRSLGIPMGLGGNFRDNLEIVYAVFNRAKNNLGNPSLPAEFSAALGLSTTLKDMVGKYFKSKLTLKGLDIPEEFKEQALFRMLDDLQNEISGLGPDGTVTAAQVKKWSEAIAAREVKFWKTLGDPFLKEVIAYKNTAPADIQKQIDVDRVLSSKINPDMIYEDLQRIDPRLFSILTAKTKRKFKKAADKFIGTKRGLRASMSKQRFEQEDYGLD